MTARIVTDVESGNIYDVKEVAENHFECKMKPDVPSDYPFPDHHIYWFLMKIEGAKNQRITVDITNCGWKAWNIWSHAIPVYSYSSLNTLEGMHTIGRDSREFRWARIVNRSFEGTTFSFAQYYHQDEVWVAERFPYTYTYGQRYLESIEENPYVKREIVGKTAEGRNIDMIFITDNRIPDEEKKCVWCYARAHAVEQDGSWVCQSMMRFLLSDNPKADTLRKNTIFVFIPILAPDAVYHGRVVNPRTGYYVETHWFDKMTEENIAIWNRIEKWINDGHSIDVCWSFHHPFSETEFLTAVYMTYSQNKSKEASALLEAVLSNWRKAGTGSYSIRQKGIHTHIIDPENLSRRQHPTTARWRHPTAAGGHSPSPYLYAILTSKFGSIGSLFEINIHADGGNYGLADYDAIGEALAKSFYDFFRFDKSRLV